MGNDIAKMAMWGSVGETFEVHFLSISADALDIKKHLENFGF